jgi:hypothetical protein
MLLEIIFISLCWHVNCKYFYANPPERPPKAPDLPRSYDTSSPEGKSFQTIWTSSFFDNNYGKFWLPNNPYYDFCYKQDVAKVFFSQSYREIGLYRETRQEKVSDGRGGYAYTTVYTSGYLERPSVQQSCHKLVSAFDPEWNSENPSILYNDPESYRWAPLDYCAAQQTLGCYEIRYCAMVPDDNDNRARMKLYEIPGYNNRGAIDTTWEEVRQPYPEYELGAWFCKACVKVSCPDTCPNGKYSSVQPVFDRMELQIQRMNCIDCEPGTFLTCWNGTSCTYKVPPLDTNRLPYLGNNVTLIGNGPVKSCYPCNYTSSLRQHYGKYLAASEFYCQGRAFPPQACPDTKIHSTDYKTCVCPQGTYARDGACAPCQAGYKCYDDIQHPCEDHYYQDEMRQSTCKPCAFPAIGNGTALQSCQSVSGKQQIQWCLRSKPETQNRPLIRNCIPCSRCKHPYSEPTQMIESCYR